MRRSTVILVLVLVVMLVLSLPALADGGQGNGAGSPPSEPAGQMQGPGSSDQGDAASDGPDVALQQQERTATQLREKGTEPEPNNIRTRATISNTVRAGEALQVGEGETTVRVNRWSAVQPLLQQRLLQWRETLRRWLVKFGMASD